MAEIPSDDWQVAAWVNFTFMGNEADARAGKASLSHGV